MCIRDRDIEDRIEYFISKGMSNQEAELKGVEDFAVECSLIKVGASEDIQNCADEGIQIFGGMGFSADTPMESAWRDARIGRIYEGTNEINRMLSVGMLLKKGMKGQIDLMAAVMRAASSINTDEENLTSDELIEEQKLIYKFKQLFLVLLGNCVQKYGSKLENHQQILLCLSDMLLEIYFSESGLLRTLKNIDRTSYESQTIQIYIVKLYIFEAQNIINKKSTEIISRITSGQEKRKLLTVVKNKCSYSEYPDIISLKNKVEDSFIEQNSYYI